MLGKPEPVKKLTPQARAEKIQREKMRALSEFDAMLKRGEWGVVFQRLPEWSATLAESPCIAPAQLAKKEEAGAVSKKSDERKAPEGLNDADAAPPEEEASSNAEDAKTAPWKKLVKGLDVLLDKSEKDAGGTEIAKLDGLRKRQENLRKRLGVFEGHLRRMMQVYPFINPSILRRIAEAGEAMKEATASLAKRRSSRAVPPEEEAIRKLAEGQNSMQQAMQQVAQRGNAGSGHARGFGALGRAGADSGPGGPEIRIFPSRAAPMIGEGRRTAISARSSARCSYLIGSNTRCPPNTGKRLWKP